jgi:hypothetical protein
VLKIHPEEADIVRRIFRMFVAGISPKAIAQSLNADGIPGPRAAWSPSTIHGHAGRGTGILNNELYIGRRVWDRQEYRKNPATGKRVSRPRPQSQWVTSEVPELRIIDNDIWHAAKAKQLATRHKMRAGIVRARRPIYLFSGLTKCADCGGGYILSSRSTLRCFNASVRKTCSNTRAITKDELEDRVLRAMKERLLESGAFEEFCRTFTDEMNRLRREHRTKLTAAPREIASINGRSKDILELLLQGFRDEAWKEELLALSGAALNSRRLWRTRRQTRHSRCCTHEWPKYFAKRRRSSQQRWSTRMERDANPPVRRLVASSTAS